MSNLIKELIKDHTVITETLNKVKSLGITTQEGQKTLLSVKNMLLAHLKKEDDKLYPLLSKAAEKDVNLKRTLGIFAKDMEEISKTALQFFEKYSGGGAGLEFAKDFGRLHATLAQRISKEENIIYKKYDQLEH
ncbi:MAG: hemerythrin domain-containing protein [bacterium]|nr:hemerythrin domain-containing protein [bacterium]